MTYDHESTSNNIITSLMVSMLVHLNYDHCYSNIYWSYLIGLNYNFMTWNDVEPI